MKRCFILSLESSFILKTSLLPGPEPDMAKIAGVSLKDKETIFLDGCDYECWLTVMELPTDPKPSKER
ncbi:uncharacterized protein J3R85_014897 [Psidium guajava]|nr:uncharacterized protein J3R85_014897 [Psidium guajava]